MRIPFLPPLLCVLSIILPVNLTADTGAKSPYIPVEGRQITQAAHGHTLTNAQVWSPDSKWLVYDLRAVGSNFSGSRIERVNVETGEIQVLYESTQGAKCGVVTYSPVDERVVFIHGPENPTEDWSYRADQRRGVIVDPAFPSVGKTLDARDLTVPFTPGALRGGTHVHMWSGDGEWICSTYEDHVYNTLHPESPTQRQVAVSVPWEEGVSVSKDHSRNHDGSHFSVVVTRTTENPEPGSDEIRRAANQAWIGENGYTTPDGVHHKRAIAFMGKVKTEKGDYIDELYVVDLPEDSALLNTEGIEGTETSLPAPPENVVQRRLTYTTDRKFPGLSEPRHWLVSSPDGSKIAFLMKEDSGVVQFYTIAPWGGEPKQVTSLESGVDSTFSWSPEGDRLACISDGSVWSIDVNSGEATRLTEKVDATSLPRYACLFSPDGKNIAYMRSVPSGDDAWYQIFVVPTP